MHLERKTINSAITMALLLTWSLNSIAQQSVTWTDVVGITINGNDLMATSTAGWDKGAASVERLDYTVNGWVETTVLENNTSRVVGLSDINIDAGFSKIDFGILLHSTGRLYVFENGAEKFNDPAKTYQGGDVLKVERVGTQILYKQNGITFYTSQAESISRLMVDMTFYHNGGTLENVNVSSSFLIPAPSNTDQNASSVQQEVTWTDVFGIAFIENKIVKTAPQQWGNAGAASEERLDYAMDGWVETTAYETSTRRMFGLSDQNGSSGSGDIDFAIFLNSSKRVYVYENGVEKFNDPARTYQEGDILKVERVDTQILYKQNDVTFYTSQVESTSRLLIDIAFDDIGGTLSNIAVSPSFSPPVPSNTDQNASSVQQTVTWTDVFGIAFIENKIVKTAPQQWGNAGAASEERLDYVMDGWVETTAFETTKRRGFGLSAVNHDSGLGGIDFAIFLNSSKRIYVYENGVEKFNDPAKTYQEGDVLKVERVGTQILYKQNDVTFYTSLIESTSELIVDIAFDDNGSTLKNITISDSFTGSNYATESYWAKNDNTVYYLDAVAIGRNNPVGNHQLSVQGTIMAQGVKVTLDGWADYVFEKDYELMSLSEVKKFIEENGHLPEIPNTEKVIKEGIYLGEMNKKLLQKIEELTLYLIEHNQELLSQSKKVNQQHLRILELEKKLAKKKKSSGK